MLLPVSPHQAPVPWPVPYNRDPPLHTIPLSPSDLHLRVMMQSLADQINTIWNAAANDGPAGPSSSASKEHYRMAIPARDYMVLRVPSHDLSPDEIQDQDRHRREAEWVMRSFAELGGIWYEVEGEPRRWVGVEPEPPAAAP